MAGAWILKGYDKKQAKNLWDDSYIGVGFPETGPLHGKGKDEIASLLTDKYGLNGRKLTTPLTTLNGFVNTIAVNDIVLMLSGNNIFVGKVTGDYDYVGGAGDGIDHTRQVEWTASINKNELPESLRTYLKTPRSFIEIKQGKKALSGLLRMKPADTFEVSEIDNITEQPDQEKKSKKLEKPRNKATNDIDTSKKEVKAEYPLRENFSVIINLPADITSKEAKRLANFIKTIHGLK